MIRVEGRKTMKGKRSLNPVQTVRILRDWFKEYKILKAIIIYEYLLFALERIQYNKKTNNFW